MLLANFKLKITAAVSLQQHGFLVFTIVVCSYGQLYQRQFSSSDKSAVKNETDLESLTHIRVETTLKGYVN